MTPPELPSRRDLPANAPAIPIDDVIVLWDVDPESGITVTKLRVMHVADQTDRTDSEYLCSAGCCDSRWLTDPLYTPLGIFVRLLADGFASREDMCAALHQFRSIEGQKEWATEMLLRLDDPNIVRILDMEEFADATSVPPAFH